MSSSFPVVAFDLDGTLLPSTTVSLLLAEWLGHGEEIRSLERAFHAGEISNRVVADAQARWLRGRTLDEVWQLLINAPWIAGLSPTLSACHAVGVRVLLATVTWRFAAQLIGEHHGFSAVSGTEMGCEEGVLGGEVTRYFDEYDKLRFVRDWCERNGWKLSQVVAVGDSRSDLPLFANVGRSIALNATADARAGATHTIDTEDLRDVLPLLSLP